MWFPDMSKVINPPKQQPKPPQEVQLYKSTVPFALKEVIDKAEKPLTEGELVLLKSEATGEVRVAVADVTWKLKPTDHVMASVFTESKESSYIFANVEGEEKFYCAVAPAGTPKEEIESLEAVLKEASVYHLSERKKEGPMPMNLGEIFKKAQHDTQMLMDQAGKFFNQAGPNPTNPTDSTDSTNPAPQT